MVSAPQRGEWERHRWEGYEREGHEFTRANESTLGRASAPEVSCPRHAILPRLQITIQQQASDAKAKLTQDCAPRVNSCPSQNNLEYDYPAHTSENDYFLNKFSKA